MSARREPAPRLPRACAAKYRVVRPLARGGFGQVWLAEHRDLRRPVALKLLDPTMLSDPTQVARFVEEARITAALSHPHIVVILDHGAGEGAPWIAYEYLEGGSLRDRLGQGELSLRETLAVGTQAAAALQQAHRQGILHRDIKPENLLLAQPGHWKVTDFGIAKWSRPGGVKTQSGLLIGTPTYLSPEQIRTQAPEPASDLYALGVVLYECLTGHPPFELEDVGELLRAHLEATPPRPGLSRPDVPPALERLVLRCLEKEPSRRFSSAAALEEALAACGGLDGPAARSRPAEARSARSAATVTARAGSEPGEFGPTRQAGATAVSRPAAQTPGPSKGLPWWLPLAAAAAVLGAAGWMLGAREASPAAVKAVARDEAPPGEPIRLERPDLGTFRKLSVQVRGPVTAPIEICVRCDSGWETSTKATAATTVVAFGPMNWADRCTLQPVGADRRPLGPSLVVTTPPLLVLAELFVVPADELVVLAGLALPPSEVEFTVESMTPPAQGFTRRARSNPRGFFREVTSGLRPGTNYRIRWRPATGWVPSGDLSFRTLGAEHGRLVRAALQRVAQAKGDETALLGLLIQANISPDPRMTPSLLDALRPATMATSVVLGRFAGVARKLRDPALAGRLIELAPAVPERTVLMDILNGATAMGLPTADSFALRVLREARGPEELQACAEFVGRARTSEACEQVVRRVEQFKPFPYVPTVVKVMLACDRERARRHLERWLRESSGVDSFKSALAILGLRLIGDERAVEQLGRAALQETHAWHRVEAADALGHCTVAAARAVGARILASEPDNQPFEWMCVRLGVPEALPSLRPMFGDDHGEDDRRRAALLTGALGSQAQAPAVRALLSHPAPLLAGAAALAAARLEGEAAGPELLRMLASGRDPRGLVSLALGTTRHAPAEKALFARLDAALASRSTGHLGIAASVLCGLGALGTSGVTRGLARRLDGPGVPDELRPLARAASGAEEAYRDGARVFAVSPQDVLLRTGLRVAYGEHFQLGAEGLMELAGTREAGVGSPNRPLSVPGIGRTIRAGASAFLGSQALRVQPGARAEVCEQEAELLLSPYDDDITLLSNELPQEQLYGGLLFVVRR